MTAEAATDAMPVEGSPATVTVRRSWLIGAVLATVTVIVAMAIAVATLAAGDDDGPPDGFPQGGAVPSQSGFGEGLAPPEGMAPPSTEPSAPEGSG